MKKITKAMVCNKPYTYKYFSDIKIVNPDPNDNDICYGYLEPGGNNVRIFDNGIEEDTIERVLHETLHAIDDEYRIGLTEVQVNILGLNIADFLVRNKLLKD